MDNFVEYIGNLGGILVGLSLIPQLVSIFYDNKIIESISIYFILCILTASTLLSFYSIYFSIIPMIIANICVLLNSILLLFFYTKYKIRLLLDNHS